MKFYQVLFLIFTLNLTLVAQEQTGGLNILKINVTDFAVGQYTLGYERLLSSDCSVNATISGVGYGHVLRINSMGAYYDESGEWFNVMNKMEVEVEGVSASIGLRKYSSEIEMKSKGFFGGVVVQWRRCKSELDEDFDDFEPFSEIYGLRYTQNISHTATIQSFGAGVELGYHWFAENGLTLDVYAGPIFRTMRREVVFESMPDSQEEAMDGLEDRFRDHYYGRLQVSDLYLGRNGSWFRAGITLGLKI
jgi:hypothetical protein